LEDPPNQALPALVKTKLEEYGLKLSPRQIEELTERLLKRGEAVYRFQNWRWWDDRNVELEFTPQGVDQMIQRLTDFVEEQMPVLLQNIAEQQSQTVLIDLKRKWPAESRLQKKEILAFRKRLHARWKSLEGFLARFDVPVWRSVVTADGGVFAAGCGGRAAVRKPLRVLAQKMAADTLRFFVAMSKRDQETLAFASIAPASSCARKYLRRVVGESRRILAMLPCATRREARHLT
jgi:hypothetical protein